MPKVEVSLSERELAVLKELADSDGLSPSRAMLRALRIYQLYRAGLLVAVPSDSGGCGGDD